MGVAESHRETGRRAVRARESQIEPAGARVGVIESHKEPEIDRERAKGNQSELETTRKSHSESGRAHKSRLCKRDSLLSQHVKIVKYALRAENG